VTATLHRERSGNRVTAGGFVRFGKSPGSTSCIACRYEVSSGWRGELADRGESLQDGVEEAVVGVRIDRLDREFT
jgi:hypothetical protein